MAPLGLVVILDHIRLTRRGGHLRQAGIHANQQDNSKSMRRFIVIS